MIPTKGTPIKREIVELWDTDKSNRVKTLVFWRDAYEGSGGFGCTAIPYYRSTGSPQDQSDDDEDYTYVQRFVREGDNAFDRRVKATHYPNAVKTHVVHPMVGFLTRTPPDRAAYPQQLKDWMLNVTRKGQSFDEWLSSYAIAAAYVAPSLLVLMENDPLPNGVTTEAQRREAGSGGPWLKPIEPTNIMREGRDADGQLEWVKYYTDMTITSPLEESKALRRYTWITGEGGWYIDDDLMGNTTLDLPVVNSWTWAPELGGRIPIAELMFFNGESPMRDLAPMAATLYNLESEQRVIERGPCFPLLAMPQRGKSPAAIVVGTDNTLPFDADLKHKPEYLSPPTEHVEHFQARIDRMIERIQEIGGTGAIFSSTAEKAAAMAYRFQALDRRLSSMAKALSTFEVAVCEIAASWLGITMPDVLEPVFPRTYDSVDLERVGKVADTLVSAQAPPVLLGYTMLQLVQSAFPNIDNDTRDELKDAVDQWVTDKEASGELDAAIQSQQQNPFGAAENPQGNDGGTPPGQQSNESGVSE